VGIVVVFDVIWVEAPATAGFAGFIEAVSFTGAVAPNGQRPGTMKNIITTASASAVAIPVCVGCIGYKL